MALYYLIPYPASFPRCDRSFFKHEEIRLFKTSDRQRAEDVASRYEYELNNGWMWGVEYKTNQATHRRSDRHVEVLSWWEAKALFGQNMDKWECNQLLTHFSDSLEKSPQK